MKGNLKKSLMILLAFVLVFMMALSACGKKQESKDEKQTTKSEATTKSETTTTAAQTTAAPETQAPAGGGETGYADVTASLIDRYNVLTYVDGAGLQADDSIVYQNGTYQYRKVTDERFQNFGDISNYLFDTFTAAGANATFPNLVDPASDGLSTYVYVNDGSAPEGLYEMIAGRGIYTYQLQSIDDITVESDSAFRAAASVTFIGQPATITLACVYEDGVWKINEINRQ